MDDFRLRVFISAARNLSFTRCAQEMYITQPAVSKHIFELEREFELPLFERNGSKLKLTQAGEVLLKNAEQVIERYNDLRADMGRLIDMVNGDLRIGASTTIAQYLLPSLMATFIKRFPDVKLSMISGNSVQIETALFEHRIDVGLVENSTRSQGLHYENFMKDELVLVADVNHKFGRFDEILPSDLHKFPLVLRENGSGTLEVVEKYLAKYNVHLPDLNIVMQLGSTEAIKSFIHNADAVAIVSIIALLKELKEGILKVIEIKDVNMDRQFAFVQRQGEQNRISEVFIDHIKHLIK